VKEKNQKKIFWHTDKRGAVGETVLHLCLLNGSSLHNDLAKRLVKIFPNLVNDVYLSDEYYGKIATKLFTVAKGLSMHFQKASLLCTLRSLLETFRWLNFCF
jgi:transient receptor potential cation channel subfamily V protein 5